MEIPLLDKIVANIVQPGVTGLMAVALLVFLYGMAELFIAKDNAERVEKGRSHMIWGIVGLTIMVSVFGIMKAICNTVGCE